MITLHLNTFSAPSFGIRGSTKSQLLKNWIKAAAFRNGGGFHTCIYTVHIKGDAAAAFSWPLALWEITEIGLAWSQSWQ